MTTHILVTLNIAVLLLLLIAFVRETRNVNENIRNLTVALQLQRWQALVEDNN